MPVICRFGGMVFKIYFGDNEHNPPHIHVEYGECEASINLPDLSVVGDLPKKQLAKAVEWTEIHSTEILEMWETQIFKKLPPL